MYYFDNSATSRPSAAALASLNQVLTQFFGNPSSAYELGSQVHRLQEQARVQIASLIGFQPHEIIFVSSGTEANNLALQGLAKTQAQLHSDRRQIIVSAIEHPAILRQIPYLESIGFRVDIAPVTETGQIDLDQFNQLLGPETLLVSTMAVNNEVGALQPLSDLASLLQAYPQVYWHVDGVQAVTTQLDRLLEDRIDLLSLSAHKFHGVRGAGILAKRLRVDLAPILYGGGQEGGWRSSTENVAANVVMAKALRLAADQQAETKQRLADFRQQLESAFERAGWQLFIPTQAASEHILCVALEGIPGEVLLHAFEEHQVYVSTTSACSSRNHQQHASLHAMGVPDAVSQSAIRISLGHDTSQFDIEALLRTIPQVMAKFQSN